jgi:hypothetical protein
MDLCGRKRSDLRDQHGRGKFCLHLADLGRSGSFGYRSGQSCART